MAPSPMSPGNSARTTTRTFLLGALLGALLVALGIALWPEAATPTRRQPFTLEVEVPSKTSPPSPGEPALRGASTRPLDAHAGTRGAPTAAAAPHLSRSAGTSLHKLRIVLVTPEGKSSIASEVYVLPAGAKGVEESDYLPNRTLWGGRPIDLHVEGAGPHDVHLRCGVNHYVENDVFAGAKSATAVRFEPKIGAIKVIFDGPLPDEDSSVYSAFVTIMPRKGAERALPYPGRGESMAWSDSTQVPVGGGVIDWVGVGETFDLSARVLRREDREGAGDVEQGRIIAYCVPFRAKAGDTVRLYVEPAAPLTVAVTPDVDTWPIGLQRWVRVEVEHARGRLVRTIRVARGEGSQEVQPTQLELALPAGAATVRASGTGVLLRGPEHVTLVVGKANRLELSLAVAEHLQVRGPAPAVEVEWPQGVTSDDWVTAAGSWQDGDPTRRLEVWSQDQEGPSEALPFPLRLSRRWVGVITTEDRGAWTTGAISVRLGDDVRLSFSKGGFLIVVPDRTRTETSPTLLLAHPDGAPIHESANSRFYTRIEALTGVVLGPFLPGVQAFDVYEGDRVIGTVRATVRADHTTPLILPR